MPTPLALGTSGGNQTLTLTLLPRSTGATNADGTAGLNLSGAACNLFPYTAAALANDPDLGTAIASSLTVYNSTNGASSGINIAASQQQAQQVFSQFAPDVSGGSRQVAIMITDQATGPVAARQRLLRSYGNQRRRNDPVGRGIRRHDQQQGPLRRRRRSDHLQGSRLRLLAGHGCGLAARRLVWRRARLSIPAT